MPDNIKVILTTPQTVKVTDTEFKATVATAGTQGSIGYTGATGVIGASGPIGASGLVGSSGYVGSDGAQGLQGSIAAGSVGALERAC